MRRIACLSLFFIFPFPVMSTGIEPQQLRQLAKDYPEYLSDSVAVINIATQKLAYYHDGILRAKYPISSAKNGVGNKEHSGKTPTGIHYVREKIGAGTAIGTIFNARLDTGKLAEIEAKSRHTGEDLITTRILWLSGLESGVNLGPGVDTYKRYIYIHGTHEEGLIGQPVSHGCVRMRNQDIVELFDQLSEKALVLIHP
jgi:lipoprotein-anchoring transpeptidase ErfK/SrfK